MNKQKKSCPLIHFLLFFHKVNKDPILGVVSLYKSIPKHNQLIAMFSSLVSNHFLWYIHPKGQS